MPYKFMRYPQGKTKAVTFSYDDGVKEDLILADICNKYGIKCTFNLCNIPDDVSCNRRLTIEEIKAHILDQGHEIAIHGYEHKAAGNCSDIELIKDVLSCRECLENAFGSIISGMAYADCGITRTGKHRYDEIRRILKSLGISYARTLGGDNNMFRLPDDYYAWMPTAHHDNPNVLEYCKEFAEINVDSLYWSDRHPRLFYLWGHSVEFRNNNNWDRLKAICEILGNKKDVWYATNIEISQYANAYDSLVFNALNTKVFNPTSMDVWFAYGDKTFCVKAGETLNF